MKQTEDFFEYCKKQKKNDEGYSSIIKKIQLMNKREKLKYKMLCKVKLNESIKKGSNLKNLLTIITIMLTLITLSFNVFNSVDSILDARMDEYIESLKRENQESRNIIDNIKNGNQENRIVQTFTYNNRSKETEFTATKSEIDYYIDNIELNNKFIDSNKSFQIQQYSSMSLIISYISVVIIFIIIPLRCSANKIEFYKNLVYMFDLY